MSLQSTWGMRFDNVFLFLLDNVSNYFWMLHRVSSKLHLEPPASGFCLMTEKPFYIIYMKNIQFSQNLLIPADSTLLGSTLGYQNIHVIFYAVDD